MIIKVIKTSRRDLAYVLSSKQLGATTVSGTMIAAHIANIPVFATGGAFSFRCMYCLKNIACNFCHSERHYKNLTAKKLFFVRRYNKEKIYYVPNIHFELSICRLSNVPFSVLLLFPLVAFLAAVSRRTDKFDIIKLVSFIPY